MGSGGFWGDLAAGVAQLRTKYHDPTDLPLLQKCRPMKAKPARTSERQTSQQHRRGRFLRHAVQPSGRLLRLECLEERALPAADLRHRNSADGSSTINVL